MDSDTIIDIGDKEECNSHEKFNLNVISNDITSDVKRDDEKDSCKIISKECSVCGAKSFEQNIDMMIRELYEETLKMSVKATKRAVIYKYVIIVGTLFVIIAGAVTTMLNIPSFCNMVIRYINTVIGFIIIVIHTLLATFGLEYKSIILTEISTKLRKLSGKIKSLETSQFKHRKKLQLLEKYYIKVDQLELNILDNHLTTSSMNKSSNISRYINKYTESLPKEPVEAPDRKNKSLVDKVTESNSDIRMNIANDKSIKWMKKSF